MLFVFFSLTLVACGAVERDIPTIGLDELVNNPENHENKTVKVCGYVTKELGEKTYFTAYAYPSSSGNSTQISLSQIKVKSWVFTDGSNEIEVSIKKGGTYLHLPVVLTSSPELSDKKISITGTWRKMDKGKYIFRISNVEEQK